MVLVMTLVSSVPIYFVVSAVLHHSKKNSPIFKWFWSSATDDLFISYSKRKILNLNISLSAYLKRTSSILGKLFFHAEDVLLGWQVLIYVSITRQPRHGTWKFQLCHSKEAYKNLWRNDGSQMPHTNSVQAVTWFFQDSYFKQTYLWLRYTLAWAKEKLLDSTSDDLTPYQPSLPQQNMRKA